MRGFSPGGRADALGAVCVSVGIYWLRTAGLGVTATASGDRSAGQVLDEPAPVAVGLGGNCSPAREATDVVPGSDAGRASVVFTTTRSSGKAGPSGRSFPCRSIVRTRNQYSPSPPARNGNCFSLGISRL